MFGKKKPEPVNLLTLIPKHRRDFEVDEQGIVTVMMPRFESAWALKYLVPKRRSPYVRTRLDESGSFVWKQIDGIVNVAEIAERMKTDIDEQMDAVHARLGLFIKILFRRTWITLHHADGTRVPGP